MTMKQNMKKPESCHNKNMGFSLIELIVVISIMAILTSVLVPQLLRYIEQSRAAACSSNMSEFVRYYSLREIDAAAGDSVSDFLDDAKTVGLDAEKICPAGGDCTFKIGSGRLLVHCSVHDSSMLGGTPTVPTITQPSFYVQLSGLTGATVEVYQNGAWKTYGTDHSNSALIEGIDNIVSSLRVKKGGMSYSFFNVDPNTPDNTTPFVVPISTISVVNTSGLLGLRTGLSQSDWIYNYEPLAAGETVDYTVIDNGNPYNLILYPKGQSALWIPITDLTAPIDISDYVYTIDFPPNVTVNRIQETDWIYNPVPADVHSVVLLKSGKTATITYTPDGGSPKTITVVADGVSQPDW